MNRGNFQKTPLAASLNRIAVQNVATQMQKQGKAWPCSVVAVNGSMVTVKFEVTSTQTLPQITIPKAESAWIRSPTQVGDVGLTVPADVYLGGISGLGGGTASTVQPPNLTALVWVPVAAKSFSSVNANAAFISGPQGAVIQTEDGTSKIVVNESGITMTFGGKTVALNSSGFTIDGVLFDTHRHLYNPGAGTATDTGGPV